ncbi:unnamed protein product [Bemisia tabaci]|uniref:Carboxylesterase type B domain-containing protein n=1 Tax=Bemisia tabaci TaxID=7038 RepID=A0A9P0AAX9_BEMTA|nr:unnamed protein product [Bemisia tabaci]
MEPETRSVGLKKSTLPPLHAASQQDPSRGGGGARGGAGSAAPRKITLRGRTDDVKKAPLSRKKHPCPSFHRADDGGFGREMPELPGSSCDEQSTYFLLYDFLEFFEKDGPSLLQRDKFLDIIHTIFKNFSPLEKEAIIFQYTDWENLGDGYTNQKMIGEIVGDYFFICPSNYFAQVMSDNGAKIYYYYFTQRTSTNLWGEWMGVMHGDEVEYVFGHPLNMSLQYNARERDLSNRIMEAFSKFAMTGQEMSLGDCNNTALRVSDSGGRAAPEMGFLLLALFPVLLTSIR